VELGRLIGPLRKKRKRELGRAEIEEEQGGGPTDRGEQADLATAGRIQGRERKIIFYFPN